MATSASIFSRNGLPKLKATVEMMWLIALPVCIIIVIYGGEMTALKFRMQEAV